MPTSNEIRQQFIDFFVKKHGHTAVPSSSVVPLDDPTLLFTNAGMNQFKDVFLGTGARPYRRAVDSQKCIRAGGKHNDLEDVGRDTYHHTFFEMLGNWSFGDYYKREAIQWAWELLTQVWGLDKSRLHATVFGGDKEFGLDADDDALKLWTEVTDIDPSHVHRFGKKDNFWMMGDTGPCGPCSEIHIDRTPDRSGGSLVNRGDARVMEIWNLVFIQYNRDDAGKLHPLPAKHVDTGMGFERVTAVLQGKESNYDTDVFSPIMDAIGDLVGEKYQGRLDHRDDVAFRVIADHLRMLTFAITDGARPSNKGRGAVVRSVLRRAFRFGYQQFEQRAPFICKLVPVVVEQIYGTYPELKSNPKGVQEIIQAEEDDFLQTIDRGLVMFADAVKRSKGVELTVGSNRMLSGVAPSAPSSPYGFMSGKDIFDLHATYGFPPDLTRQMAEELGLAVDMAGYDRLMGEHEEASRASTLSVSGMEEVNAEGSVIEVRVADIIRVREAVTIETISSDTKRIEERVFGLPDTNDRPKWNVCETEAKVMGFMRGNKITFAGSLGVGDTGGLVLDSTCFYAEAGGQVGDRGTITTETGSFKVTTTLKLGKTVIHVGAVDKGRIMPGQAAHPKVSPEREFTRKNHTATHLLHWALHKVLGEHVEQRGSKVKPDEFTFDFSHNAPLTETEKREVERLVNERIYQDLPVQTRELPIAEAKQLSGVRAFFGDKYGDVVRVVEIGDGFSREFCGGTHLEHTGQAGYFKIIAEEGIAKGVRRLTCVTAREAVKAIQAEDAILTDLTDRFRCRPEELPERIESLQEEIKKLQQQLKKGAASDLQGAADKLLADANEIGGAKIIVGEMPPGPEEQMRQQLDRLRQKAGSAVVVIGWSEDSKVQIMTAVTDDLVKKGLHAGKLVGQVAKVVGGGGGGKPTMAQAGGKDPSKLGEALQEAGRLAQELLLKLGS